MHVHNWTVIAIKLDGFDYDLHDFLYKKLWRRCLKCGKRDEQRVDIRLKVKEINLLYSGEERPCSE